jgi:hypothetical protein
MEPQQSMKVPSNTSAPCKRAVASPFGIIWRRVYNPISVPCLLGYIKNTVSYKGIKHVCFTFDMLKNLYQIWLGENCERTLDQEGSLEHSIWFSAILNPPPNLYTLAHIRMQ